ncbi:MULTISPECIES: HpcH/HpaI aldolase/citrate lyase family protein [Paracoccus]|uniref:Citrate lyase subunit beta/citryl-CoA lyase n=1 Tax=Paracoccus versutus TaxID=34007 RepID=A0A3D9XND2_PARVE|nr:MULTISPECIES: CoA ester lyase [Paracoccus]REF71967.1 citrate lyase subunit beta/citryl-CoA lyase [Paracoccus versutus]
MADIHTLPLRSLLFCPGSNADRMGKAMASGADAVILDLEDSVDPAAKAEARALVAEALAAPRALPVAVRVNAADTAWHLADLAMAVRGGADAIMLPKCGGRPDLAQLSDRIDALEAGFDRPAGRITILPLVTESALALLDMDYRAATPRLAALCFAGEDLASDLGVMARASGQMNPLLAHARRQVAIAAAAAGVRAIDTPFPDPRAASGLELETREALALGFAGKLCIHPAQIATVHATLRPAPERVEWGRAVIAALEGAANGVAVVDGKMVDIAHLRLAHRYVQMAALSEGTA